MCGERTYTFARELIVIMRDEVKTQATYTFVVSSVKILPENYEKRVPGFPLSLTYDTQENWFIITVTGTGSQSVAAIDYSVAGENVIHRGICLLVNKTWRGPLMMLRIGVFYQLKTLSQ